MSQTITLNGKTATITEWVGRDGRRFVVSTTDAFGKLASAEYKSLKGAIKWAEMMLA
jgi:hypothetical protein